MGIGNRVKSALKSLSTSNLQYSPGSDDDDDGDFRCIQCGNYFHRNHHTCPDCGGNFVVRAENTD
jgi:rRNA maturation endonuclease Nob1